LKNAYAGSTMNATRADDDELPCILGSPYDSREHEKHASDRQQNQRCADQKPHSDTRLP
jgi:hypothetical protein